MKTYYRPIPISGPASADAALRLAGGWVRFNHVECLSRTEPPRIVASHSLPPEVLEPLVSARSGLAGLTLDRPRLMGILNVTPDSFSDGGRYAGSQAALAQAKALVASGADILDIGGESTRPGAAEVPAETEIARVAPVIEAIRDAGLATKMSVDTRKAQVAQVALRCGADFINDVSAFRFDPDLAKLAAETKAPVILMHSIATPETMQSQMSYDDVLLDVYDALERTVLEAEAAGIQRSDILVDPGIGFGKNDVHNQALLSRISLFHGLGCAILLGVSRKGFIGRVANVSEPDKRDPGSAALGLWAVSQGVQCLRVHDIAIHKQTIALWQKVSANEDEE